MYHGSLSSEINLLLSGLAEDGWPWDVSTRALGPAEAKRVTARLVAKSAGVWAAGSLLVAASEVAARELGAKLHIKALIKDGTAFTRGRVLAQWSGPAGTVLALERPFLNLASMTCGIATRARELRQAIDRAWAILPAVVRRGALVPRLTPTRKTLPGYRDLCLRAAAVGGAEPHRLALSGGVLLKENHLAVSGKNIRATVSEVREKAPHPLRIEVEVRSLSELDQAVAGGAEIVMLDNFSPSQVKAALKRVAGELHRPLIEVSGGISAGNIATYVIPGVDVISSGAITHSPTGVDLSLLVGKAYRRA